MANISRNSFDESKGYDKVILQQGVPITDYDFNEAQDIQRFKLRRIMKELFGDGAIADGFKVVPNAPNGQSVIVKAGALYVSGWRVINTADLTVALPAAPGTGTRTDYVWVECTETEIDSIMDPAIRHDKLTIEPTRRTKVGFTIKVGSAVPADTATVLNYTIANIARAANNNTIIAANITDARSVKITFEGAGFSVKGSASFGDEESDIIDIQGAIKNSSNTFGGKLKLDDSVIISNDLDVGGYVKTVGVNVQIGKYNEVARFPLFGIAGDIQYQSDVVAWEDVTSTIYSLFNAGLGAIPNIPTGATRQYKLLVIKSDNIQTADAERVEIRIVTNDGTTEITKFRMGESWGGLNGERQILLSPAFQTANPGHMKVQARIQNAAGNLASTTRTMVVMAVHLIAYDVYN